MIKVATEALDVTKRFESKCMPLKIAGPGLLKVARISAKATVGLNWAVEAIAGCEDANSPEELLKKVNRDCFFDVGMF